MNNPALNTAELADKVVTSLACEANLNHEEGNTPELDSKAYHQKADMTMTDAAARKVWALIEEEGNLALKLRVYITGGGCSGFQYGFTFDEAIGEDDKVLVKQLDGHEVYLLVDPLSYQYLHGAEIDYSEGITGAQFIIRNPNAQTTCGCGSSFSV